MRIGSRYVLPWRVFGHRAAMGILIACLVHAGATGVALSQGAPLPPPSAMGAAIGQARALLDAGDTPRARGLLDSLVQAQDDPSDALAEALYWRAVLADSVADAERDWKRLLLAAPLSPRVPLALVRLAELEMQRSRPAAARQHVARLFRDHPMAPERSLALLWLARAWMMEQAWSPACGALAALASDGAVPPGERRLQANDLASRCEGVVPERFDPRRIDAPVVTVAARDVTPPRRTEGAGEAAGRRDALPRSTGDSLPRTGAPGALPPRDSLPRSLPPDGGAGRFTVQLAAMATPAEADAVMRQLGRRGVTARVDAEGGFFKVRVGGYATRREATAELARLKRERITVAGFVTERR